MLASKPQHGLSIRSALIWESRFHQNATCSSGMSKPDHSSLYRPTSLAPENPNSARMLFAAGQAGHLADCAPPMFNLQLLHINLSQRPTKARGRSVG